MTAASNVVPFPGRSTLDLALELAGAGFHVFALAPGSKEPVVGMHFKEQATRDPDTIRRWFTGTSNGVAIYTGRFGDQRPDSGFDAVIGVDIDTKLGKQGNQSIVALELDGLELPATREHTTLTGGKHKLYRTAKAVGQRQVLGADIDIRSDGGYLACSIGDKLYSCPGGDVAPAPEWLVQRCAAANASRADNSGAGKDPMLAEAIRFLRDHPPAIEGQNGDDHTYWTGCRLKDFDLSLDMAVDLAAEIWNPTCEPPWSIDGLRKKFANAYSYGREEPGAADPRKEFGVWIGEPENGKPRLPFEAFDDIEPDLTRPWLVKHWLDAGGSSLWYGPKGSNKTFLMLHVALCVAMGRDWLNHKTKQGPVLYCALEGGTGIRRRIKAMKLAHGLAGKHVPIYVSTKPLNLSRTTRQMSDEIIETIREIERREGQPVALVVIDTVHRSLCGADENDSAAVGAFIANLDAIRYGSGAHVAAIHHTGKDASRGARGSSAFGGDVDTMILVGKGIASIPDGELGKQRDGAAGVAVGFRRVDVPIGHDADDDPVNSCVIESAPLPSGSSSQIPEGSHADRLLRLALRAQSEIGMPAPERLELFPGATVIPLEKLGGIFIDEYVALKAAGMSSSGDEDKRQMRKSGSNAFGRAVLTLEQAGKVKKDNQFLWFG